MSDVEDDTPPVGEELHLPGPSYLPLIMGAAITAMVIGLTISWWFSIVGVAVFIVVLFVWIRDTRRDIDELPEEHAHH